METQDAHSLPLLTYADEPSRDHHHDQSDEKDQHGSQHEVKGSSPPEPNHFGFRPSTRVLFSILITSLVWLLFLIAIGGYHHVRSNTGNLDETPAPILNCSDNPSEARAFGCLFELWSYSWVPEPCFDPGLQDDFRRLFVEKNFSYYTGPGSEFPTVDLETVSLGSHDYKLWVSAHQHFWHCAFVQRKFFRADPESRVGFTNRDHQLRHIKHCQRITEFADSFDRSYVDTVVKVGYSTCEPRKLAS